MSWSALSQSGLRKETQRLISKHAAVKSGAEIIKLSIGSVNKWNSQVLLDFLSNYIMPSQDKCLTSPLWEQAFTHPSVHPTDNYRVLATMGDSVMSLVLFRAVRNKYNNITSEELTNMRVRLLSTAGQAEMLRRSKLECLIKSHVPISDAIREDVMEAFFGAIMQITEDISLAQTILENLITIERDMGGVSARVKVLTAFAARRWRPGVESVINEGNRFEAVIYWPIESGYDQRILASVIANTRSAAIEAAYQAALPQLEEEGILYESYLATLPLYPDALQKAKKNGYKSLVATHLNDNIKGVYWFLYGDNTLLLTLLANGHYYRNMLGDLLQEYLISK